MRARSRVERMFILAMALAMGLLIAYPSFSQPPDLVKELWLAPGGKEANDNVGNWAVDKGGNTRFSFSVPADFEALISAEILVIGDQTKNETYDLFISVSQNGLARNFFNGAGAANPNPIALVKDQLHVIDITSLIPAIEPPDDFVSVAFDGKKALVVGMRLRYRAVAPLGGLECADGVVAGFDDDGSLVCKDDSQFCGLEQLMVGFDLDGIPICKADSQACAADEVMVGFDLNGDPVCKPDSQTCDLLGQVMVGFDLDGSPICKADTQACGADQVMVGFNLDGSPACKADNQACEADQVLVGFDLSGDPLCADSGETCPDGQVMESFDLGTQTVNCRVLSLTCPTDQVMTGFNLATSTPTCIALDTLGSGGGGGTPDPGAGAGLPKFSISDAMIYEGNPGGADASGRETTTTMTFKVTLDNGGALVPTTASVDFTTANGSAIGASGPGLDIDYRSTSGTLTLTASADGTSSQNIQVVVFRDTDIEPDETFFVNLSNPSAPAVITDSQGVGTIKNDDVTFSINDVTLFEGDSVTTLASFTVTLSGAISGGASVDYATADGTASSASDYNATSGTLSFVGTSGETQSFTVDVNGDLVVEGNETFFVNLSNPSAGSLADGQGQGTIDNDDAATFSIGDAAVTEGDSGTTTATFTVTLTGAVDGGASVDFATADGTASSASDYDADTGSLSFVGNDGETQTITVSVNGDLVVEGDETFFVGLSNPSTGTSIVGGPGEGTITDDDTASLSIDDVTVDEGDGTATFTISIGGGVTSASNITVQVDTTNGSAVAPDDYTAIAGATATILANTTSTTVSVSIVDDGDDEPDEDFTVGLSSPSGAVIGDGSGTGTIQDNDPTPP